jgi:hypothetical protein
MGVWDAVQAIRVEMKPELIPLAEDKATFGKLVKKAIRYNTTHSKPSRYHARENVLLDTTFMELLSHFY